MLEEFGVVVEVNGQFALVQIQRNSSCGQCTANQSCGTASLATVLGQKYTKVKVINHVAAKVGDKVVIGLEEQALLKSALALYLLPLLCMFAAAMGYELLTSTTPWFHHEILTVLAGLMGLMGGLIGVKRLTLKMSENKCYQPMILKTEVVLKK